MRYIFIIIVAGLMFSGCRTSRKHIITTEDRFEPVVIAEYIDLIYEPYMVRKGDTLSRIAKQYRNRDTLAEIIRRNNIKNPDMIQPGQTLYIQYPQRNIKAQP